jgi:mannose-6-phosphate isomerase-like protein (cupin superfamily)
MRIIRKTESVPFSNSESCQVLEYDFQDDEAGIAVAEIKGRYPERGFAVNDRCKEIAYVISGNGKIGLRGGEAALAAGDTVLISEGDEYFWEGNFSIALFSAPAWNAKQCRYPEN